MTEGIVAIDSPQGEGARASERDTTRKYLSAELERLWSRGRDILGCDLAIMGGDDGG